MIATTLDGPRERSGQSRERITHLDGLRGLAIFLVLAYHAYARYPEEMPFGEKYAGFIMSRYGWLGVQLFFLISGFVILMTLERCSGFRTFLKRRWLRLFPAMLLCSLFISLTATWVPESPRGHVSALSLLPALTFIEPSWWEAILRRPVPVLEGAFWSIYVEFKFYVFAGAIYFWRGRRGLMVALTAVFLASCALRLAARHSGGIWSSMNAFSTALSFEHFGWFAAGAATFIFTQSGNLRALAGALGLGLIAVVFTRPLVLGATLMATALLAFFLLASTVPLVQRPLNSRMLQFMGFISYPLYLLHENLLVGLTIKLAHMFEAVPAAALPPFVAACIAALAFIVARSAEPWLRRVLVTRTVRRA